MTLTELKYIVAVARERHFGKAADSCFVSQPTLSVAIKKLEKELDLKLFERSVNEVSVTPLGEAVLVGEGGAEALPQGVAGGEGEAPAGVRVPPPGAPGEVEPERDAEGERAPLGEPLGEPVAVVEAELGQPLHKVFRRFDATPLAAASIAQAQESIGEARSQILQITRTFQEDVAKELSRVQNDLFDLAGKIRASTDVLERLELRAPAEGYVVGMNVHTKGGVIGPGKTVLQIVPSKDVLVVSVRIQPQESDKVTLGASAHIRFPSIHDRKLGNLNGTVTYLSADRLADERSGQPYFLVRVTPDTDSLAALKNHVLLPGLPADVMIESGQRTMLQYLISPIIEAFDHSMREQ